MSICDSFAKSMAEVVGLTYSQATKLYPRCDSRTVYISEYEQSHKQHCVHCARADSLAKYGAKGKYTKYCPLTPEEIKNAEKKEKNLEKETCKSLGAQ